MFLKTNCCYIDTFIKLNELIIQKLLLQEIDCC